ncbi:MAG TPA: DUF433 domain-containing protein [Thermomicrobiales bacterium]|nr:DUF433 domain-containing protein [Thermomicrobiales bacterium]
MAYTGYPPIKETPGVCGGYPCIGDTRIPVRLIVEFYRGLGNIEGAAAMLPQLTLAELRGALADYEAFPARVGEDIERNAAALAEIQARRPA